MIYRERRPILYVDDTVEQRYAMRRILETEGYRVVEAGSGQEALQALDATTALAVVDVKLPDINGYELTRQMRQRSPHLPVLQVSASFTDPDLRASGLSGGADAYIAQPVHPPELIALITRMLNTWEVEEGLRFLAGLGPRISTSLSIEVTCQSLCDAVCPYFADECVIFATHVPGMEGAFWSKDVAENSPLRELLGECSGLERLKMVNNRLILVPLQLGDRCFGAIAFELKERREYTANDRMLALDIAHRTSLALQNCLLFTSEQATQTALLQAEKLATAGRMSAAIAHEINNPLEAVTNLVYIIQHSPEATESIRASAASALDELTRLAHITRQTLGFYRELRTPTAMDLSESVRDTVELYAKRLNDKSISLRMELADTVSIWGTKGEIRQVISNLLLNAIEAIDAGGHITIKTDCVNEEALIRIEDDGPGIASSAQTRIFEPFYTTKQGTGTGLGLWVAKTIVEKHGGEIQLDSHTSTEDHGTVFTLAFPAYIT